MRIEPLLQYYCSRCGKILNENTSGGIQKEQLKEECPVCGALLLDTLQNRSLSVSLLQQASQTSHRPFEDLSIEFQTAFQQIEESNTRLTFDIKKIDSLLTLNSCKGSLCIIGEQKYAQLLIDRLCVRSLLPRRHGGIEQGYTKIIAIDAGNCTNVYQFVEFARQYGLEVNKALQNIVVSRVSTIYQLAHLIVQELPKIIQRFSSRNKIIMIYGLLHLFVSDPHIDKTDAKHLIKEISSSLRRLSKDRFVIVSFADCNGEYEKPLMSVFEKRIEITDDSDDGKLLQTKLYDRPFKRNGLSRNASLRRTELTLVSSI
jgi:DNA-directed RNA polymerase subunit RPC12/RpoP